MNNHKSDIVIEHEIEYHSLKFNSIDKDDVKFINKFIQKYKYVKIIHELNNNIEVSYYKNNAFHNDFGPSILYKKDNEMIINKKYYLNGVELSYDTWKNRFRKYKLLKLKEL